MNSLKLQLARVFDDNLRTKQWQNYVDYTIIGLILLSTLEVFLSTYEGIVARYGLWLKAVDYFTTGFFSIEVALRIWCADVNNPKYKGFWGRVRYCFSFYGLIDILATYTFYLQFFVPIPYLALKTLRVARLLRIFRYVKGFNMLSRAIRSKKYEMIVSGEVLCVVTIMLSFILFFVEHEAQPDVYVNGWTSVLWAFVQYIGDPGHFAETPPITFWGRLIACLIGVLGIAIFAVPAGLTASAFSEVIEKEIKRKKIEDNYHRMLKQFPRYVSGALNDYLRALPDGMPEEYKNLHIVTRAEYLSKFQTRLGLDFKDIADVTKSYPELRLRDMADEISDEQNPVSNLVVELVPVNCSYGCFVNRESKVTIMVTNGFEEMGSSWFGYHVALLGGFNFICKNQEADPDERDSYYAMSEEPTLDGNPRNFYEKDAKHYQPELAILDQKSQLRKDFLRDLQSVCGEGKWVINLQTATKSSRNDVDFNFIYDNRDHSNPSVEDIAIVEELIAQINKAFALPPFNYSNTAQQSDLCFLLKRNIAYQLRGLNGCEHTNVLHIRISSELININLNRSAAMFILSDLIRKTIDPTSEMSENDIAEIRAKGFGYPFSKKA